MLDSFDGIPTHPLIVHIAVVFIPVFALLTIAYCVRPPWRGRLQVPVIVTGLLAGAGGFLAGEAGEKLEHRLENVAGVNTALVHEHAEAGDLLKLLAPLLALVVIILVLTLLSPRRQGQARQPLPVLLAAVLVLGSGFACYQTYVTGHSGAKATWSHAIPR